MRQRLGIAQAIIHKPNLLILDEPTNGLDPEGIKEMRELLINLAKEEKMAILISSHNLAELDNLCNKVCIIKNGEIIETSGISEIKQESERNYNIFEINNTEKIKELRELLINLAQKEKMAILISSHNLAELDNLCNKVCIIKNGEIIETSGISEIKKEARVNYNLFEIDNTKKIKELLPGAIIIDNHRFKIDAVKEEIPEIVELLVNNKIAIYQVKKEEKSLEEAFFEKTGGNVIE